MPKFRLSTILLVVALIGVALGWYVDRNAKPAITGTWRGPESPLPLSESSYSTQLVIRPNGTFSQTQKYDYGAEWITFDGSYVSHYEGEILFRVSNISQSVKGVKGGIERSSLSAHRTFLCRCTIDQYGYLIIYEISSDQIELFGKSSDGIPRPELNWGIYYPR